MSILGDVFSIFGNILQQGADDQALSANLSEMALSQGQSKQAATDALRRGGINAGFRRMQGSALLAKQRVAYANSGVDATVGTPLDVAAGSALLNEFDVLTIENNAAREALGHTLTAQRIQRQKVRAVAEHDTEQGARYLKSFSSAADAALSAVSYGSQ